MRLISMFVLGLCLWCSGGFMGWRGIHILSDSLRGSGIVGSLVAGLGILLMVMGLLIIHRVFSVVNPGLGDTIWRTPISR